MVPRNLETLTKEVREPLADAREVIQDLIRENVVVAESGGQPHWKMDRYTLRADLGLFLSLARQYLEGPHKFRFLGSQFASNLLVSDVRGTWKLAGDSAAAKGNAPASIGFWR